MRKINKENEGYQELIVSVIVSAAVIWGFLLVTGTFFTGYHLADDHEFLVIRDKIQSMGLAETIVNTVKGDLNIRFRPVYQIFRVLGVFVLGINWKAWYFVKATEMVAAMTALYWFARRMKADPVLSVMFTCVSMCGMQAEIWCRLGPQESFGLFLLTLILLLETYPYSRRRNAVLSVLIVLMSGMKEAFILTMPALCFFAVWYELWQKEKRFAFGEIWQGIRENLGYILIAAAFCVLDLLVIVLYVGTNEIGYAGISAEMTWKDYIWSFLKFFGQDDQIIVYYGWILVMTVLTLVFADYKRIRAELGTYISAFLMLAFVIGGQIVLHIKSGMRDRYLIPWIVGVSCFIFLLCFRALRDNRKIRGCFYVLCVVMCILTLSWTPKQLLKFVETGNSATFVISTIEQELQEGERVVTCLGASELDLGIVQYLYYEDEIKAVYCQRPDDPEVASDLYFGEKEDISMADAEFLVGSNTDDAERELFEKSGLNRDDYEKSSLKRYAVYKKVTERE